MDVPEEKKDEETVDLIDFRNKLLELEREYNSIRQDFYNKSQRYYNQSIAGNFVSEDHLRRLINKCEEIKKAYAIVQSELMANRPKKTWSYRDDFKLTSQISRKDNHYGSYRI